MPRQPLSVHAEVLEDRLRVRTIQGPQPITTIPSRERGVRAAAAVLSGDCSSAQALQQYQVTSDSLKHFKKKLLEQGFSPPQASSAPGSGYSDIQSCRGSDSSNFVTAWDEYCQAYIFAGELVGKYGRVRAAEMASAKYNVSISASTARRAAESPGEPPRRAGAKLIIPAQIEHKLESLCLALRELKMPIFRFMILNYMNVLVKGTDIAEQLKHKEVRRHWYYNWLGRCKRLTTANIRPLEVTRAKWATPENVGKHYDMVAEKLLELGLAVRNTAYDPKEPYSSELIIIKPGRIASMDETRLTNDTTEKNKANQCRSIVGTKGDAREVLMNKGGGDGTGIGGSTADGVDLPGFFIFANNILHAGAQNDDIPVQARPVCRRQDPLKPEQALPCRFWANAKGGVTGDLGVRYIRGCVEPAMPGLSPDSPGVLIMDGHGSHFTLELLTYCRSIGLHVILRPPHTTHILQGEDVQHFAVFKAAYHQAKLSKLGEKVASGGYRLTVSDLLSCARQPWETAFNLENTLAAWEKIGISPFNRRVYWDLIAAKQKREQVAAAVSIDPELLTVQGMVKILFPNAAAKEGDDRRRSRDRDTLHSSDLWDLPGGATGDDCYNKVKAKVEKRRAKEESSRQRKQQRLSKRQQQIQHANALGSRVVSALVHDGQIAKLKVDQLKAALCFKGVQLQPAMKKACLASMLSDCMQLPSDGPMPNLVIEEEPGTSSHEHQSCAESVSDSDSDNDSEGDEVEVDTLDE